MIFIVMQLRDMKANLYKAPMFVPNINAALRDLFDMVNEPNGKEDWQRHPEDFQIFETGTWDSATGKFTEIEHKHLIALSTLQK